MACAISLQVLHFKHTGELRMDQDRFDIEDREQLAAQVVAVMDAHFQRPTPDQKRHILKLAEGQIRAQEDEARQKQLERSRALP